MKTGIWILTGLIAFIGLVVGGMGVGLSASEIAEAASMPELKLLIWLFWLPAPFFCGYYWMEAKPK